MGRNLLEQKSRIDPEQRYTPREALELLKGLDGAKFDESVEAHIHLNVDPRRADQMVRGTLMLPNGTGKTTFVRLLAGDIPDEGEALKQTLAVSLKPQTITPKFPGSVRMLLLKRIK